MKKRFLIGAVALLSTTSMLISCGNSHDNARVKNEMVTTSVNNNPQTEVILPSTPPPPPPPTTSYPYTIIDKKESTANLNNNQILKKMTYTVEIQTELSKNALDEIADVIAHSEPCEYVFIEYYLTTQAKSGPNYGLSKRTPIDNSSQINYIAPPAKKPEKVKAPYDGCKVYGKWNMMGAVVIAYQKGSKCYMVNYYGDSNFDEPELYIKTTIGDRTAFKNSEDLEDVYIINSYGDLDGYYYGDHCGTFYKAQ